MMIAIFILSTTIYIINSNRYNSKRNTPKPIILTQQDQQISEADFNQAIEYLESPTPLKDPSVLINNNYPIKFTKSIDNSFNFGYSGKWNWIRLKVKNTSSKKLDYHFLLDKSTVQFAWFLVYKDSCKQLIYNPKTGINYPFYQRPAPQFQHFVFPLEFAPKMSYTLLLCIRNQMDSLNASISLLTSGQFHQFERLKTGLICFLLTIIFSING